MPTDEPQIFITVRRTINDQDVKVVKEISLSLWQRARFPGSMMEFEINTALKEIGWQ